MINQISVPGWDSFKIGTFEEKLHHYDRDIGNKNSDESEPSNDLSFKNTLEEFPNIYKTSHEEKTKFKPEKKKPKKKYSLRSKSKKRHKVKKKTRRRKRPMRKNRDRRRKGGRPPLMVSGLRMMFELLSRPGRNLAKGANIIMSSLQRNIRRMSSGFGSRPMLDFLRRPGDYFSNFQTNGGAGPPGHTSGGGGGGGGGGGNPLGAVAGILTNNPLTDAVGGVASGVVGDGSLSRKDFVLELTTWFRRVIWFLGFTAATTASVPLFLVTAALAAVFELVYNVTNARAYWEAVHQYGAQDHIDLGNIDYVSRVSALAEVEEVEQGEPYTGTWRYVLGLPPPGTL